MFEKLKIGVQVGLSLLMNSTHVSKCILHVHGTLYFAYYNKYFICVLVYGILKYNCSYIINN